MIDYALWKEGKRRLAWWLVDWRVDTQNHQGIKLVNYSFQLHESFYLKTSPQLHYPSVTQLNWKWHSSYAMEHHTHWYLKICKIKRRHLGGPSIVRGTNPPSLPYPARLSIGQFERFASANHQSLRLLFDKIVPRAPFKRIDRQSSITV